MSKLATIINITAFCIWAVLIAFLLHKDKTGIPLEKQEELNKYLSGEIYWYDIYSADKKIGFANSVFKRVGDEIIVESQRQVLVKKEDEESLLVEMLSGVCDLNYAIKSFEFTSAIKGEKGLKISGETDAETVIFYFESPEKRDTQVVPTNGRDIYLPLTLIPVIHQKKLPLDKAFSFPMLNIINLSISDVRVALKEIRALKVSKEIRSIYKYSIGSLTMWIDDKGTVIKETIPSGITLYRQVKDVALETRDRILFDYTSLPLIKSNKVLADTEKLKQLKIKVKGFTLEKELYEKSYITLHDNTLTIEKADWDEIEKRTYKLPSEDDKLSKYVSSDEWVLSETREVLQNAQRYAKKRDYDAFRMAKYLSLEFFILTRFTPNFVLLDSFDIADSQRGDHMEFALMVVSMGRAVGLPTRLIGGLVYIDGYFYFHTWPEVWFDKWVPVDPTLEQFPADVTHIPLKEGTLKDITSIVDDLKNMEIEILEVP